MKLSSDLERQLQRSGLLLIIGLGIEGVCLLWARPIAFVLMVAAGGFFCAAGVAVYLYALVSRKL
ncbi:MAG: hypothetical protein DMG90_19620 [Acidobacteria bacterium]|nr:MAG: hypothetical protein DMG90_19620 [Acidobacteriota bacterium]